MRLSRYSLLPILMLLSLVDFVFLQTASNDPHEIVFIGSDSPHAVKSAEFAVLELSRLSDSGIYGSLQLSGIISAAIQDGIFHNNTLLTLDLSSPHFKSKKLIERYNMIVMVHKEDGVRAIAIDEFPEMDEDAIEEYYIRKVEQRREEREAAFRRIELENYFARKGENSFSSFSTDVGGLKDELQGKTIEDLLIELESKEMLEERQRLSEDSIQVRLQGQQLIDEQELQKLPLNDLFAIVTNQRPASDYQKFRAQTLLDVALRSI